MYVAMGGGGSAGIYRGAKFSLFEGGIRVPAIISYPKELPENEARDQFAVSADWFPTILELAGIEQTKAYLDGKSLTNVLADKNAQSPHTSWVWEWQEAKAIRKGNWKLHINPKDTSLSTNVDAMQGNYLYDLSSDPSEQNNIALENPERVDSLLALLTDQLSQQDMKEVCSKNGPECNLGDE